MSTIALPAGDWTSLGFPTPWGITDEAREASKEIRDAVEDLTSEKLFSSDPFQRLLWEMASLEVECASDDWDGYGAAALNSDAIEQAIQLVQGLPAAFRSPILSVHPDGEASLTWRNSRGGDFSISVGPTGRLSYAGIFGPDSLVSGRETFADGLPAAILDNLRRIL